MSIAGEVALPFHGSAEGALRPPFDFPREPRVLVVIPALNEMPHIDDLIQGLSRSKAPGTSTRLVVVDGGSSDGTREAVEGRGRGQLEVHCLHNPARIQSAGINLAARTFGRDADVLIRCDAHADYPPAFFERLLESLQRTGADAVVVPMDTVGSSSLQRAIAWVSNSLIGTGGAAHRGGTKSGFVDHGHHAAFRMDTFRRVGGYDESFSHNEDAELDCRQRAAGARVFLDATIRVRYHPRSTWSGLARQYFHYGCGRSRTVRRHPGSARLRQLALPLHLAMVVGAILLSPLSPLFLLWPALYASVLAVASVTFAVRHRSTDGLMAGPAAAVMHLAWGSGFVVGLLRSPEKKWRPASHLPLWELDGATSHDQS